MMEAFEIELATVSHVGLLSDMAVAFRDQLGRESPANEEFNASIRSLLTKGGAEFLMAVASDGSAAGFVQLRYRYSMWLSANEACIEDLFVVPNQRRQHLGTTLVEHALERAVEKGCASAVVDTNERNIPAIRLYSRLGFSSSSGHWDAGNQLWLRKRL